MCVFIDLGSWTRLPTQDPPVATDQTNVALADIDLFDGVAN